VLACRGADGRGEGARIRAIEAGFVKLRAIEGAKSRWFPAGAPVDSVRAVM